MADPFEVRMRFTNLLTHLSASTTSSIKTAHYALKHRDMDEDLHSCIIENLERGIPSSSSNNLNTTTSSSTNNPSQPSTSNNTSAAASMNNRANIMYFLLHFCEIAVRENHPPYLDFIRRDINKIVNCVAASGANVKVVRHVVSELGNKGVLSPSTVTSIEEDLRVKEQERGALLGDGDDETTTAADENVMVDVSSTTASTAATATAPAPANNPDALSSKRSDNTHSVPPTQERKSTSVSKADKRAIEQRIEEDRERHKRLREGVWAVSGDDDAELEKMWDEGSDLSEDDYVLGGEEAEERGVFARYHWDLVAG